MIPQKNRLQASEFNQFKHHGHPIHSPFFTIIHLPTLKPTSRFSIIVSKKIYKQAVARNHLKRQISHVLTSIINSKSNSDFLILPKPSVKNLNFSQIFQNLSQILKRAKT